jgi:hypothetical protein
MSTPTQSRKTVVLISLHAAIIRRLIVEESKGQKLRLRSYIPTSVRTDHVRFPRSVMGPRPSQNSESRHSQRRRSCRIPWIRRCRHPSRRWILTNRLATVVLRPMRLSKRRELVLPSLLTLVIPLLYYEPPLSCHGNAYGRRRGTKVPHEHRRYLYLHPAVWMSLFRILFSLIMEVKMLPLPTLPWTQHLPTSQRRLFLTKRKVKYAKKAKSAIRNRLNQL